MRPPLEDMLDRAAGGRLHPNEITDLAQSAFQQIIQSFTPASTAVQAPEIATTPCPAEGGVYTANMSELQNSPGPDATLAQVAPAISGALGFPLSLEGIDTMFYDTTADLVRTVDQDFDIDDLLGLPTQSTEPT